MSAVYSVLVIDEIQVDLTASQTMIDVNETVVFDASGSYFKKTGDKAGLVFQWICEDNLQNWCDFFKGMSTLEITHAVFKQFLGDPK
jgi:hypothetical protein